MTCPRCRGRMFREREDGEMIWHCLSCGRRWYDTPREPLPPPGGRKPIVQGMKS